MILKDVNDQGYATYNPGYVALAYHLPEPEVFVSNDWLSNVNMDLIETMKRMMLTGKHFRSRATNENDTEILRAP